MAIVDWVEHALETECAPYLHTPDEELSWLVLHSADVVTFALAVLLAVGAAVILCMRAALLLVGVQAREPNKLKQT